MPQPQTKTRTRTVKMWGLAYTETGLLLGCHATYNRETAAYLARRGFTPGTVEPVRLSVSYALPAKAGKKKGGK